MGSGRLGKQLRHAGHNSS